MQSKANPIVFQFLATPTRDWHPKPANVTFLPHVGPVSTTQCVAPATHAPVPWGAPATQEASLAVAVLITPRFDPQPVLQAAAVATHTPDVAVPDACMQADAALPVVVLHDPGSRSFSVHRFIKVSARHCA